MLAETEALIAPIGHNQPPADEKPDPFLAHVANIDDLYVETSNWTDGTDIETEAQAAEVDRLINLWKEAIEAAEASRDAETKPLQEKVKAVQEKYWPLVGETKKITGKAIRAKTTLLAVKTRWAVKVETARRAEADRLRKIADEQAATAAKAARDAIGNLAATEQAEDMIKAAQTTQREAAQLEKPAVSGMRDRWQITGYADCTDADGMPVDGRGVLLRHYLKTRPEALVDACMELARQDVIAGKHVIPGLNIENLRRAV